MYIYVLFLLFLLLISMNAERNLVRTIDYEYAVESRNHHIANSGFVFLFLIFALRHQSMGNDLRYLAGNGYLGAFDTISQMSWSTVLGIQKYLNYERGYIILNKVIGSISSNRQFFLAAVSFLSLYPICRFVKTRSVSPAMSYVIFMGLPVILMYYSGLRQILAIAICVLSIDAIEEKKLIRFLLLIGLATLFHKSAWIFVISYPLFYFRPSKRVRWISVGGLALVYILRYRLFATLSYLFKDEASLYETNSITLFLIFTMVYVVCFLFVDEEVDHQLSGYINLFYVACMVQSFAGIYNLAMRVGYYFMVVLIVLLPNVISNMQSNNKKIFTIGVAVSFSLFGLYSIGTSVWAKSAPYYFFWQNV